MENKYLPRLVFWETTRRCNLSCIHCRAMPIKGRLPEELTLTEAKGLIDQIAMFGSILVLSGGEPLFREDIFDIADYAQSKNLKIALATNGTLVTKAIAKRIKESNIKRVSVSLDGADEETHDGFRQTHGSFKQAIEGFKLLKEMGLSLQINATIAKHNFHQLDEIFNLALTLGVDALHIFLLVPVGCGQTIPEQERLSPQEHESVLLWLYERAKDSPIHLKATCAPQYFRIMRQKNCYRLMAQGSGQYPQPQAQSPEHSLTAQTKGCLAATGICFVSYQGDIYPCGYLPVSAGNIRQAPFSELWNSSEIFLKLREPRLLKGKCGACEFVDVCEGCRARAYAKTGDYLDEEPECIYKPLQRESKLKAWDFIDRNILNIIQGDFPLVSRPYAELAKRLGILEGEAFLRIACLRSDGVIRRIGGFFNSKALGYKSLLVGLRVSRDRIEGVGGFINRYQGVTHNYARGDIFNLWFTLTCESQERLRDILNVVRSLDGVQDMMELPAIKYFKLDVHFDLGDSDSTQNDVKLSVDGAQRLDNKVLDELDREIINILSQDLPQTLVPFKDIAKRVSIQEEELFCRIALYKKAGMMRKFGAVLNHRSAGFNSNVMVVWKVPEEIMERVGELVASFKQVSHCYCRPAYPDWPYNLYAMLHCHDQKGAGAIIEEIELKTGIKEHRLLFTEKEFKKTSMEYLE